MDDRIKRVYIPMTETGFYILFCLQEEMHGYNITQNVKKMTNGAVVISPGTMYGTLSKGTREKVQLVLVMSRRAKLYLLDEPIGGVDPAARDFILQTIIQNYDPEATVLISTHLITDIEPVLDDYIFLHQGNIVQAGVVDDVRGQTGKTLDELFREVFRCLPSY